MNRTLKLALGVVMTAGIVLPVVAQENFPDVPDNHWAYEALKNMKNDGLLVGYPDGLFRGQRPASRYELAVAIHATYQKLKGMYDGLDSQIKALSTALDGKADKADLQNLRDALTALQNDVAGMKAWGDDIANLKKLADKFEKEIASLGVDVEAMKKDIGDIKDKLNNMPKPAVDIHGTVDLLALAGYSSSDRYGIRVDGGPTGVGRESYSSDPVGVTRDLSIMHEAALNLSGTNTEGPKWNATLVIGNMLGYDATKGGSSNVGLGTQGTTLPLAFGEAEQSIYLQNLTVTFDTSVLGQNFTAEVGRTAYKVAPYIFQRPDVTPYFANERWDDGKWMFDGAILGFNLGPAKLTTFGGRTNTQTTSGGYGSSIQPLYVGKAGGDWEGSYRPTGLYSDANLNMRVDQFLGLQLVAPITEKAQRNLAYLWLDSDSVDTLNSVPYNRLAVMGGDLKVDLNPFTVDGGYAATVLQYNEHKVLDKENAAWWVNAGYKNEKWGVKAGYKNIETNFAAPGDWGRVGMWWNPTDIKGWNVGANLNINEKTTLKATGEWYTGINDNYGTSWTSDQKLDRYTADLGYKINTAWDLNLGWEYVRYDLSANTLKPEEIWYNIGLNYGFSDKAKLSILWQISDYNSKEVDPFVIGSNPKYTGGLITTQLSIKF